MKLRVSDGLCAPYVALSYCWGPSQATFKTTRASLAERLSGIPWTSLPRTFQDTVAFCWELGVRYLWIDALCIVQDDPVDWEREAVNMQSVYSNSFLTVAATRCPDNNTSLFSDRWTTLRLPGLGPLSAGTTAVQLDYQNQTIHVRPSLHLAHDRFIQMDNAKEHAADAPLLTRAWAYQERLLPPRCLHFHSEELVWECSTGMRCECAALDDPRIRWVEDHPQDDVGCFEPSKAWLKSCLTGVIDGQPPLSRRRFTWFDIVSEFSQLELTYEKDRLPAVAGLAARLSRPVLGRYLAGIWEGDIAAGLLWKTASPPSRQQGARRSRLKAPSWSWASIPGPNAICYDRGLTHDFAAAPSFRLIAVEGTAIDKYAFVSWPDARLKVEGLMCDCTILIKKLEGRKRRFVADDLADIEESGFLNPPAVFQADEIHTNDDDPELFYLHLGSRTLQGFGRSSGRSRNLGSDQVDPSGPRDVTMSHHRRDLARYGMVLRWASSGGNAYERVGLLIYIDALYEDAELYGRSSASNENEQDEVARLFRQDPDTMSGSGNLSLGGSKICQILLA